MRIMVVDVAAEHSGALTVLNQFIDEFVKDKVNEYYVVLSSSMFKDFENVKFITVNWVKRSHIHRLFFDNVYSRKLISDIKPDTILSLQNNAVYCGKIRQEVFFHNALPISEKHYSIIESPKLWVYQNIIGNIVRLSLKRADIVYVQAEWIKRQLQRRWNISAKRIVVKRPNYDSYFRDNSMQVNTNGISYLFYPANNAIYKNHMTLFNALLRVISNEKIHDKVVLVLTLNKESLSSEYINFIENNNLPIEFTGRLSKAEMKNWYSKSLLVFPSYIETIGLPLAEAKDMKCRIIAADCEYAHETIAEYDKVTYFNPYSFDELSDALCDALS